MTSPACCRDDHHHGHDHDGSHHHHSIERGDLIRIGILAVVIVASLTDWWVGYMTRDWLALAATLIGGIPIFKEAWQNLLKRRMTMELSMSIALIAALGIGQFFTALVIAFFVLFAELLEGLTMSRGRRALGSLIDSLPRVVTVRRNGVEQQLGIDAIGIGEEVIIRPGERIPCDGVVIKGISHVEQASITGEPLPVRKEPGDHVFAGTVNANGVLEVTVERLGRETTYGKIIEAVEEAEQSRAPVQRVADRLAAGLVYFAFAAAIVTFLVTRNWVSTISVIIVAGACGVAAGTPLALLAGIGNAARRGIVVKGGLYLEQLSQVNTVVLDKTGTLTIGTPKVVRIHPAPGVAENELLRIAAIAEQHSEHPFGNAIMRLAAERRIAVPPYDSVESLAGKGIVCRAEGRCIVVGNAVFWKEQNGGVEAPPVSATGETSVVVGADQRLLGEIVFADELREEAVGAIATLKRRGYRILMLTGDSPASAAVFGAKLGIQEAIGGMLPEDKEMKVKALKAEGAKVVMVGDGVNDAPALAHADVGIAMGQGSDLALESADVALMTGHLGRLVDLLAISKRCYRVILFNFWGTIVVDLIGIGLACTGQLTPILAAMIHVGSELGFILNSARLFRDPIRKRFQGKKFLKLFLA